MNAPALPPDELPEANGSVPILLIVEDKPEIRSFLLRQLSPHYQVLEAGDGKQALTLAIEEVPGLIISDILMPHMNGFEFCEHIKSDRRTSHIPFILLTALADQEHKLDGLKQGADAYLSKPFSREELFLRIAT